MSRFVAVSGLVCLAAMQAWPAGNGAPATGGAFIAEVDGVKLTTGDLERKRPTSLVQARNTFYQAERKVVDQFVDDYLLERQAEKEHVTVAELLERHVNGAIAKDPSEEALHVYYEGANTPLPFEAVRGQIVAQIRQVRMDKTKAAYLAGLRSQANIAILLDAPRVEISLKDTPVRGRADAPVKIVEYADYECPACQQINPTLEKLTKDYGDKVAFAYKDSPLPMHAQAQKAAEAARCAGAQGKYWEYHDRLFSSKQLGVPQLKEQAAGLQLDTGVFNKCLDSGAEAGPVKQQLAEAMGLQLEGTPSFFINGRLFGGTLSYDQLRAVVDEELRAAAHQTAAKTQTSRR